MREAEYAISSWGYWDIFRWAGTLLATTGQQESCDYNSKEGSSVLPISRHRRKKVLGEGWVIPMLPISNKEKL